MAENSTLLEQDQEPRNEAAVVEGILAEPDRSPLAIVGIGSSAGGLEALEQFFTHLPADSGMAFAVISHQDPTQTSLLPEILQRYTDMPVVEIGEGGVEARQNTVYTKPSDSDLAIVQGSFTLMSPARDGGAKTTIQPVPELWFICSLSSHFPSHVDYVHYSAKAYEI